MLSSALISNLPINLLGITHVLASSGGNDSIALIQYMLENHPNDKFLVLYNDTGWSREDWPARIQALSDKLASMGILFLTTKSIGFEKMVENHKGFPMPASAMQFCTSDLKTTPTREFLEKCDPARQWTVVTGRRREESSNRAGLSMLEPETKIYLGRDVYNPLIMHDSVMRDELIYRFGMEPLPHSSMECFPCVCSKRSDLQMLKEYPSTVAKIKSMELRAGHTSNGKPRTMFRPYRNGGGVGIEQVIAWAVGGRGTKLHDIPKEYQIKGVDYSKYRGDLDKDQRVAFWADIKAQCVALGYDLSDLPTDLAYDDASKEGQEFARQCDGGLCGT
jgi:hypothetical protein